MLQVLVVLATIITHHLGLLIPVNAKDLHFFYSGSKRLRKKEKIFTSVLSKEIENICKNDCTMQVTSFSTHFVYSFSSYNIRSTFIDLITCIFHSIIKN